MEAKPHACPRALIVCPIGGDLLAARAERGERHGQPQLKLHRHPAPFASRKGRIDIEEGGASADGRTLFEEVGKCEPHLCRLGVEPIECLREHRIHLLLGERLLTPRKQDLKETAHVRPLELHRQGDGEGNRCQHLLIAARLFFDEKGKAYVLDPDALNGDAAPVLPALYVLHQFFPSAYGMGSCRPASAKPRSRRRQLSQTPHAVSPPR